MRKKFIPSVAGLLVPLVAEDNYSIYGSGCMFDGHVIRGLPDCIL